MAKDLNDEFNSPEVSDAIKEAILPPLDIIEKANIRQIEALTPDQNVATFTVSDELKVVLWIKEASENDPYVIIRASADPHTVHVVINRIHPYYDSLEVQGEMKECLRQYIYDAIAEYKVSRKSAIIQATSVRKLKDVLLRARETMVENAATALQQGSEKAVIDL